MKSVELNQADSTLNVLQSGRLVRCGGCSSVEGLGLKMVQWFESSSLRHTHTHTHARA